MSEPRSGSHSTPTREELVSDLLALLDASLGRSFFDCWSEAKKRTKSRAKHSHLYRLTSPTLVVLIQALSRPCTKAEPRRQLRKEVIKHAQTQAPETVVEAGTS